MNKRDRLLDIIKQKVLFEGEIVLSSGKTSNYYIDCRRVTLDSEGACLISEIFCEMLEDKKADFIGGLTLGADPITGGVAAISFMQGRPISGFIVRKNTKEHGRGQAIEGPIKEGSNVVIIDDVATSGGSLLRAIEAVKEIGCTVIAVLCVVDRMEGAREMLSSKGYELSSIFTVDDLFAK